MLVLDSDSLILYASSLEVAFDCMFPQTLYTVVKKTTINLPNIGIFLKLFTCNCCT